MRTVLGKEQYADDGKEAHEDKPGPRGQKAGLLRSSMARVILMGHMSLLLTTVAVLFAELWLGRRLNRCARPL